jgi:predicted RND superfamily exporter protein
MAVGTDANLGANHPAVQEFDAFLEQFGGGYPIMIAYECANHESCARAVDPSALEMASAVSLRLEQSEFVSRVSSPATTRLLVPSADFGIETRRLVEDGKAVRDSNLLKLALADPLWSRTLLSLDGRVGAIVVELSSTGSRALSTVMGEIRQEIGPYGSQFDFHLVGEAVMHVAAQEDAISSASRASVATGAMLFLTLMLLIRSLPIVVASLATIGVASVCTIGALPLFGWQQSELTNGAATLILVIGCADCVHFGAHYLEIRPRFADAASALESTARWVLGPCFLTTATTVGAFASFATGEVIALTQFGVMAGIGISLAFLLTFTFFPALLLLLPGGSRSPAHSGAWQEILGRLTSLGTSRRRLILVLATMLAALGVAGIPKLQVEMKVSELWAPDHPVMRAIDFVSENLQRADRIEIGLTLPPEAQLEDPETMETVEKIHDALGTLGGLGQARSLATVLRHANQLLGAGASDLPDSKEAIAELILLTSAGAAGSLDPWMTLDQRHLRLSIEVERLSMQEQGRLLSQIDRVVKEALPLGWKCSITGPVVLASRFGTEFSRGQTNIISASSFIVFLMIGIYLRSLPWAFLAVIPNAVALLLLFGAMGHWEIRMNFGSAIVAPIAIGIAADDTIHFLTAYARERRSGRPAIPAVAHAIAGVGEAVIATAIALALGFLSMVASPMASVADMGLLCAIAIIGATLADLLVLPALIATVAEWRGFQRLPGRHE